MANDFGKGKELFKSKGFDAANAKHKALKERTKGHKHGEREARSKKAGHYVHGHKNYGDVYEA